MRRWREAEGGYAAIQSTKPQTLGYALTDLPAGLAGWIAEKFRGWSDCGGKIENAIPLDVLLANIAIYWFSGNIASSLRIYRESRLAPLAFGPGERVMAPLGFAHFPKEILHLPRAFAERVFDVRRWTEMPRGGDFRAPWSAQKNYRSLAHHPRTFSPSFAAHHGPGSIGVPSLRNST